MRYKSCAPRGGGGRNRKEKEEECYRPSKQGRNGSWIEMHSDDDDDDARASIMAAAESGLRGETHGTCRFCALTLSLSESMCADLCFIHIRGGRMQAPL